MVKQRYFDEGGTKMKRKTKMMWTAAALSVSLLAGCSGNDSVATSTSKKESANTASTQGTTQTSQVIEPHKGLNQPPVPIKIERTGPHDVNVEMTAQITDIEIDKGKIYKAWTFNGQAPGPLVVVNEGDTIHFTLKTWIQPFHIVWTSMPFTLRHQKILQTYSQTKPEHFPIQQTIRASLCTTAAHRLF